MPGQKSRSSNPLHVLSSRLPSHWGFRWPGLDMLSGLVLLLITVHLLLLGAGGPSEAPWYYQNFGLSWGEFSHGKIWQLITHGLLHGDWFHLSINVLVLWLVGWRVVEILGTWKCFQIILCGALAGGMLHLFTGILMLRTGYIESYLVGISGACLALLLTLTTLMPYSRLWLLPVSGKNLGLGIMMAELLLWLMHPGLGLPVFCRLGEQLIRWGGPGIFQISHACHLGGALAGWWIARKLLTTIPDRKSSLGR